MTDDELAEWALYGASLNAAEHPMAQYHFGEDVINLWRVVAAVAQRHLDGLPEPTPEENAEVPLDFV